MDKLKKALSGDDGDEEQGIVTQFSDATKLSWETRIKGFVICFVLGVVLSILATALLFMKNGLVIFAVLYTFGNVLALASTCFLMGPLNQLKKMFAKTRIIATILVLVMFVLTLVCAFALKRGTSTGDIVLCFKVFLIDMVLINKQSLMPFNYISYIYSDFKKISCD
ncbi:Vesicle transport protein SFT2A,Vesicle transport protein SFT2B [Mytilus edulis]|uniref:Vesicle transport protein n=1 Tax=Mytilus edulis TaxID=6550 RepID=A0A8S3UIA5_MYTED|nr:Vesicle transport protein SFT2A,Vesicle transport protein SFT2B [Mytilus edulis]